MNFQEIFIISRLLFIYILFFKKKGTLKRINNLYPGSKKEKEEDTFSANVMEYVNINMEFAISYVLNKGKVVKEKIDTNNLSKAWINENIVNNKHFNIAYNSYLQRLIHKKTINAELKNVSKKGMEKLENFFNERIDKCLESEKIHTAYI